MIATGKIISNVRKKRKLNQKQLAEKVGMSRSYLSELEAQRKQPTIEMFEKILDELKVKIQFVYS